MTLPIKGRFIRAETRLRDGVLWTLNPPFHGVVDDHAIGSQRMFKVAACGTMLLTTEPIGFLSIQC